MPRPSLRKKDGQVSVLIAAFIALSMLLMAFGIDIAHVLVEKRHAQNAADASALYVGQFLPLNTTDPPCDAACQAQVSTGAGAYSGYNGGPSAPFPACSPPGQPQVVTTNCYLTPYNGRGCPPAGCSNLVQIRIHEPVHLWFAGVVPGLAGAINGVNAKA